MKDDWIKSSDGYWRIAQGYNYQAHISTAIPPLKDKGKVIKRVDNVTFVGFRR